MSAAIKRTPADEWEREFYADDLKEERQADRGARVKASNFALAFNAFCDFIGCSPDVRRILYVLLMLTRGKAPHEELIISETEAGRHLPGGDDAADSSKRKRWVRAYHETLVPEMARLNKRLVRRVKGSITLATRHTSEKKQAPIYFAEIAQIVVDVERSASRMNGLKREVRFQRAAAEVFANLPAYQPTEDEQATKVKVSQEKRPNRLAGRNTRRMTRFANTVKEMIAEAQREGPEAVGTLRSRLHSELETLFADAETATKSDSPLENETCENAEENCEVDPVYVDNLSTLEGETQDFPDYQTWLKSNGERVDLWCDSDTERWQMYEAEKALAAEGRTVEDLIADLPEEQRPTAFRLIDEHEKRKGAVIYAEEYEV